MTDIAKQNFAEPEEFDVTNLPAAVKAGESIRPPMLAGPKRQHFLPRFYLDGFTRDGLLAVFDRDKNEIRLQQPVNTAVIGHFYTMEDADGRRRFELEALMAECEGKARPVIDKLVAAAPELNADERSDLSIFIALAATRTPDMVNSVQALNGEIVKHTAQLLFSDVEEVFARLRSDEANWAAAGFKDTLLRLSMKQEIANGNEKAVQSGVQG